MVMSTEKKSLVRNLQSATREAVSNELVSVKQFGAVEQIDEIELEAELSLQHVSFEKKKKEKEDAEQVDADVDSSLNESEEHVEHAVASAVSEASAATNGAAASDAPIASAPVSAGVGGGMGMAPIIGAVGAGGLGVGLAASGGGDGADSDPVDPNMAPVMAASQSVSTAEDTAIEISVGAEDPEGGKLSYLTSQIEGGRVFGGADGKFTFIPDEDFVGEARFVVSAKDPSGATSQQTITIDVTPVEDAPRVDAEYYVEGAEDTSTQVVIDGHDPDGDQLTYTVGDVFGGVVTGGANGIFEFTPHENFIGEAHFVVTLRDGNGGEATQKVFVEVEEINDAPVISSASRFDVLQDGVLNIRFNVTDEENDSITYQVDSASNGQVVVSNNGVATYTPSANFVGQDAFTLKVSDGRGGVDVKTVIVTVHADKGQPIESALESGLTPVSAASSDYIFKVDANAETDAVIEDLSEGDKIEISDVAEQNGIPQIQYRVLTEDGQTARIAPLANQLFNDLEISFTSVDGKANKILLLNAVPKNITVITSEAEAEDAVGHDFVSFSGGGVNNAPFVKKAQTVDTDENQSVEVTVDASDSDQGAVLTYAVSQVLNGEVAGSNGSYIFTPTPNFSGVGRFTVTITDEKGASTSQVISVNVAEVNEAPIFASNSPVNTDEDVAVNVTVTASDPDGDDAGITYAASNFVGGTVTGGANGQFTFTPNANFSGEASFDVTATDAAGGQTTQKVDIVVASVDDAPVLDATQTVSGDEDSVINVTVTATDVDSSDLTYSVVDASVLNGSVAGGENGVFAFTPDADFVGQGSFQVRVTDGVSEVVQTVTVNVADVNDAPIVEATQLVQAVEDQPVVVTVTGATDVDQDALTYTAQNVQNGSVTGGENGVFTFTPDVNFNGETTFDVVVSDGRGGSATQTVTVDIASVNDAPTSVASRDLAVAEEALLEYQVIASDVDEDELTYTIDSFDTALGSASISDTGLLSFTSAQGVTGVVTIVIGISDGEETVTQTLNVTVSSDNFAPMFEALGPLTTDEDTAVPFTVSAQDQNQDALTYSVVESTVSNGTVEVLDADSGQFRFTPEADYTGEVTFDVRVSDGNGGEDTQTVTVNVTPVNDAPVFDAIAPVATDEDVPVVVTMAASDVDSQELTYAFVEGSSANGSVVPVDGQPGQFTFTPDANFNGEATFRVSVTDGESTPVETIVTVNVSPVNDAPVFETLDTVNTDAEVPVVVTLSASDVDQDSLTYAFVDGSSANGTVVPVDGQPGQFTFTPTEGFFGEATFRISVTDGNSTPVETTVTVNVAEVDDNIAPVFDNPFNPSATAPATEQSVNSGDSLSLAFNVFDEEDTNAQLDLTWSVEGLENGSVEFTPIVPWGRNVIYTPDEGFTGEETFTVVATDSDGADFRHTMTITVEAAAPEITVTGLEYDVSGIEDGTVITFAHPTVGQTLLIDPSEIVGDLSFSIANFTNVVEDPNNPIAHLGPDTLYFETAPSNFTMRFSDGGGYIIEADTSNGGTLTIELRGSYDPVAGLLPDAAAQARAVGFLGENWLEIFDPNQVVEVDVSGDHLGDGAGGTPFEFDVSGGAYHLQWNTLRAFERDYSIANWEAGDLIDIYKPGNVTNFVKDFEFLVDGNDLVVQTIMNTGLIDVVENEVVVGQEIHYGPRFTILDVLSGNETINSYAEARVALGLEEGVEFLTYSSNSPGDSPRVYLDIDNELPEFDMETTTFQVYRHGTVDITLDATDADGNDITYSATMDEGGIGNQQAVNGNILTWSDGTVDEAVDQYTIEVSADDGQQRGSSTQIIQIQILDNDRPVFDQATYATNVELGQNGSLTVDVTDSIGGVESLVVSSVNGLDATVSIDSAGNISIVPGADLSANDTGFFTVTATDIHGAQSVARVDITMVEPVAAQSASAPMSLSTALMEAFSDQDGSLGNSSDIHDGPSFEDEIPIMQIDSFYEV